MNILQICARNLLPINKFFFFIVICLIYSYFYFWNSYFYYNEDILFATYGEQISFDRISLLLSDSKRIWLPIALMPFVVIFRVGYTTLALSTGIFFVNNKIEFKQIVDISLKAEIAFILMYVVKWIFIEFVWKVNTLFDLSVIPFSLYHYFAKSNMPLWSTVALSYISIWEILYMFLLAVLLGIANNKQLKSNILFIISTYGIALVFWIVILTFVAITIS